MRRAGCSPRSARAPTPRARSARLSRASRDQHGLSAAADARQSFKDGRPLGRVNDVMADGKGGAYFTAGGAFHVSADGVVTVVEDQNLRSNGIMLSPDGKTLYVTNQKVVIAFDVKPDGSTANRRDSGALNGDDGGDGMAVDSTAVVCDR